MPSRFYETVDKRQAHLKPIGTGRFGAQLAAFDNGVKGILKVRIANKKLFRGVPITELPRREVAIYHLDRDLLHFDVVPETLLISWKGKVASIQEHKEGVAPSDLVPGLFDKKLEDWKYRVLKFANRVSADDMLRIVLLDLIVNNTDRHAKNVLVDPVNERVFAIDNGMSFAPWFARYRNVFHKYLFFSRFDVPDDVLESLGKITRPDLEGVLGPFLHPDEITQTHLRIRFIVDHHTDMAFQKVSQGHYDRDDFPTYEKWFKRRLQREQKGPQVFFVMPGGGVAEANDPTESSVTSRLEPTVAN